MQFYLLEMSPHGSNWVLNPVWLTHLQDDNVETGGDGNDVTKCETLSGATTSCKNGKGSLLETKEFILGFQLENKEMTHLFGLKSQHLLHVSGVPGN